MAETLQELIAARVSLLLRTITWSFAGEMLRQHHDFAAVSGTEMQTDGLRIVVWSVLGAEAASDLLAGAEVVPEHVQQRTPVLWVDVVGCGLDDAR